MNTQIIIIDQYQHLKQVNQHLIMHVDEAVK